MKSRPLVQLFGQRADLIKTIIDELGCTAQLIATPEEIKSDADICLAWGVYSFIKSSYLNLPRLGVWGFHESPLPVGRGCAPLHWTVLNGGSNVTVSFFKLIDKMDAGPLLDQTMFPILRTDLMEDLRQKSLNAVLSLIKKNLLGFLKGELHPHEQNGEPTFFRKRTGVDSQLDIAKPLAESWDLIRVCDNELYPAWFEIDGQKFILKRYKA